MNDDVNEHITETNQTINTTTW